MNAENWITLTGVVLTFLGTVIAVVWGNKRNESRTVEQKQFMKEQTDLTLYRIKQLEEKQNKYNNLIERVFKVESEERQDKKDIEEIKQGIQQINERINRLHS